MAELSIKHKLFVDGIQAGKSLVQAYLDAGYKTKKESAYTQASNLIRNHKIIAELQNRFENNRIRLENVLSSMGDGAQNVYTRILRLDAGTNEKLLELQRRVAVDVFDRMGMKPVEKQRVEGEIRIITELVESDNQEQTEQEDNAVPNK